MKELPDQRLIELAQGGNKQAFGYLVQRYMQRAYYVALSLVGSHDDALDLSQDAFVRSYKAIQRFKLGKNFFTWFYKILRNLCFNHLRNKKHRAMRFSDLAEYELLQLRDPDAIPPDKVLEKKEIKKHLWQAIQQLSEQDREIILLREFHELSYQEIAEALDCPSGTVMSRLYYSRKRLAQLMQKDMS
jgi:RNA polymerase sigma-70 factor (ECF subfamily)